MKLHIFNPEHDIALALNKNSFTPSHNVVKMRRELAFLPSLWAEDGDIVLVEDVDYAYKAAERLKHYTKDVRFITLFDLREMNRYADSHNQGITEVDPWGWDLTLVHTLKKNRVSTSLLPNLSLLSAIRTYSHRRTAMKFLRSIGSEFKAYETTDSEEINKLLEQYGRIVLKSPWSCSGRGVRFMDLNSSKAILKWAENVIHIQGSVMVEPYYDKLHDFAIEFMSDANGLHYCGLSLFKTHFTSYSTSIIATEEEKMEKLNRYTSRDNIYNIINVCKEYLQNTLPDNYRGGIGIDMMVVKDLSNNRFLIHPCVEINLRRTMGHTALSFPTSPTIPQKLMVIDFDRNFELKVKTEKSIITNYYNT